MLARAVIGFQHSTNPFDYYKRLKKVREYVERHYFERISLHTASEIACLETKYFSKFFHERTGCNFLSWLEIFRVAQAMKILETDDSAIFEIAYKVGFGSVRTFDRAFKRKLELVQVNTANDFWLACQKRRTIHEICPKVDRYRRLDWADS